MVVVGHITETNTESKNQLKHIKHKLQDLATQYANNLTEFETISLLTYLEEIICDSSIYFIFFLDFRGRMYTISTYGPVSNKIIRNILVYNDGYSQSTTQIENKETQTYKIIREKYFHKMDSIKLKNNSDLIKCTLF
jgi:hypothetical protein